MNEESITIEITKHGEEIKSLKHRMDKLEEQTKAINNLTLSVKELAFNVKDIKENQISQNERLEVIERKPAKKWEQVTMYIVTYGIGIVLGYLFSLLIGK